MNKSVFAVLAWTLCVALPPSARAFLGDDLPTIEARYGAALNRFQLTPGVEASVHESAGYRVLVLYRDGRSSRETFSKLGTPPDFTAAEINTFLRAHGFGRRWDFLGAHNRASLWATPDTLATYLADGEKSTLAFDRTGDNPAAGTGRAEVGATPSATPADPSDQSASAKSLTLGTLESGQLELGKLEAGKLDLGQIQTGKLQAGKLQTDALQTGSLDKPARPIRNP